MNDNDQRDPSEYEDRQPEEPGIEKKSFYDKDMLEWDSEIAGSRGRSIMPEQENDSLSETETNYGDPQGDSTTGNGPLEPSFVEIRDADFAPRLDEMDSNRLLTPHLVEAPPPEDYEEGGMGAGFIVADNEFDAEENESNSGTPSENLSQDEFSWDIAAFAPPGPTEPAGPNALSIVGNLAPDQGMLDKEVTDSIVHRLMQRTEVARQRVNQEIDSIQIAQDLLDVIRSGKTLLMSGKENYEEAERMFNEVEYRLAYNKRVKFWSGSFAFRLLAYEIGWLFALGLGAFLFPPVASAFVSTGSSFLPLNFPAFINPNDVFTLVSTMMWGGLGGVVGAMYSLWRHVSVKQDFNPQHSIWYFTQPLMGMPIGAFIFITLQIGIVLTYDQTVNISNPMIIYSIAWIAGFQQNVLYEIVRQIIKLFRIERSSNPVKTTR